MNESEPVEQRERYPDEVLEQVDVSTGKNRVWFGRLCAARIDEADRCQIELQDFNGEVHLITVPPYRVHEARRWLGRHIQVSCMEVDDESGGSTATAYYMRQLLAAEIQGRSAPRKSLQDLAAEQGLDLERPPDYAALLADLFPTRADVMRFREHLADLRGD